MKSSSLMSLIITGLLAVGSVSAYAAGEEVQGIKINKESASSGDGNTVKLMGNDMVTISMDLPFAQQRFAKEAKIKNVTFYSDYKSAEFGKNNGLLMDPLRLLARAVIVTDKDNVVRYIQVVPEVTQLPDMQAAMDFAKTLL